MERASIFKSERNKNYEFLRATQFAKNHDVPFEVAPDFLIEPGHIYPSLGMKYVKGMDFAKKRQILEPRDQDFEVDWDIMIAKLADEDGEGGEESEKKHESTYVREVVQKRGFDKPEIFNVLMVEWMGKWPNPVAKDEPFSPYVKIGLLTSMEMETYELSYDCKFSPMLLMSDLTLSSTRCYGV